MSSSKLIRRIIKTAAAGPASGPYRYPSAHSNASEVFIPSYSQAVQVGQTLYLSGSLGLDPKTGQFVGESVGEQARQVEATIDRMKDHSSAFW